MIGIQQKRLQEMVRRANPNPDRLQVLLNGIMSECVEGLVCQTARVEVVSTTMADNPQTLDIHYHLNLTHCKIHLSGLDMVLAHVRLALNKLPRPSSLSITAYRAIILGTQEQFAIVLKKHFVSADCNSCVYETREDTEEISVECYSCRNMILANLQGPSTWSFDQRCIVVPRQMTLKSKLRDKKQTFDTPT